MFFDSAWRYVTTGGRQGSGSGEIVSASSRVLRLPGDSIVVLDRSGTRTSIFTRDGEFAQYVNTRGTPGPLFIGRLRDGSFLALNSSTYPGGRVGEMISRNTLHLWHLDQEGDLIRSLGEIPGTEVLLSPRPPVAGYELLRTKVAVHDRSIYAITGDAYEIRVYDVDQGHVRTITFPHRPVRYSVSDFIERFSVLFAEGTFGTRLRLWPEDKVYPAVTDVATDEDGYIWVEEYGPEGESRQWRVFSNMGEVVATVRMPDRFRPYQIFRDRILGVEKDEFDVERVQVRSLIR